MTDRGWAWGSSVELGIGSPPLMQINALQDPEAIFYQEAFDLYPYGRCGCPESRSHRCGR
jgi:hypothetical protein